MDIPKVPFYNIFIGVGFITGYKFFEKDEQKYNISDVYIKKNMEWIVICLTIISFLGAALFENFYHEDFSRIGKYGITFYGGLLTAIFLSPFLLKLSFGRVMLMINLSVPGILLAHTFGRIGCFLTGCCYGKPFTELGVSWSYLHNNRIPIQLIESFFLLCGFFISHKRVKFSYRYFFYFFYYCSGRFILEFLRADDRGKFPSIDISPSQVISILLFSISLILFFTKKQSIFIARNSI